MPVFSIGGDKANGAALGQQATLVATNASSVVLPNTGHWIMEERPQETMAALMRFLEAPQTAVSSAPPSATLPQMRLTPDAIRANQTRLVSDRQRRTAGCQYEGLVRRSIETGLLYDRPVSAGAHDNPGPLPWR